jgi:hypothetical protein
MVRYDKRDNLSVGRDLYRVGGADGKNFFFFNQDDLTVEKSAGFAVEQMQARVERFSPMRR